MHRYILPNIELDTCGLTTYNPRMAACKSRVCKVSSNSRVKEATVEAGLGIGWSDSCKRGVDVSGLPIKTEGDLTVVGLRVTS